jgi:hypothetical protein
LKGKKDIRTWLFTGFAILVIGITGFNIYLDNKLDSGANVEKLQARNVELTKENIAMEKQLASVAPSSQERDRQAYIDVVDKFIHVTMKQEKEGFDERRHQAKSIMSEGLFELFYPSETFQYEDDYKSTPMDVSYFLQSYEPNGNEVNVIVEFNVSLLSNGKEELEVTNNVIKMTLERKTEKWIVTDIKEINMSIV